MFPLSTAPDAADPLDFLLLPAVDIGVGTSVSFLDFFAAADKLPFFCEVTEVLLLALASLLCQKCML